MPRVAVLLTLVVAACDVGSVRQGIGGTPDGGGSGSGDGSINTNCEQLQTANVPDGHHNAGQACLQSGCHLQGQTGAGAPPYSFAGTLYADTNGTSPKAGAKIILSVGIGGAPSKLLTAVNGNFYIDAGSVPPLGTGQTSDATASGCPDNVKGHAAAGGATGQLQQGQGNCNNCHNKTTDPVLHLP